MSSIEDLEAHGREGKDDRDEEGKDQQPSDGGDAEMKDVDDKPEEKEEDVLDDEILHSSTGDINMRRRLLENELRIMQSEYQRLTHEKAAMIEKIKDNMDKIENNRYALLISGNGKYHPRTNGLCLPGNCRISWATWWSY